MIEKIYISIIIILLAIILMGTTFFSWRIYTIKEYQIQFDFKDSFESDKFNFSL